MFEGKSWVMAVTKTQKAVFRDESQLSDYLDNDSPAQPVLGSSLLSVSVGSTYAYIHTNYTYTCI